MARPRAGLPRAGWSAGSYKENRMPQFRPHKRQAILLAFASLWALAAQTALGGLLLDNDNHSVPALSAPFGPGSTTVKPLHGEAALLNNPQLIQALTRGQWSAACAIATSILAQQQPDVDALGVFAMCAALRDDKKTAGTALLRLDEAEAPPHYYAQLTQGVLSLRNKSPDKANILFSNVLGQRPGDPLALYFTGEALHSQRRDGQAISAFRSVLASWPDHAPALSAVARLTVSGTTSKDVLQSAIALTERAAKIEPTNLAYWQQLAELYDRGGERGRASAIRLQWLTPRTPK